MNKEKKITLKKLSDLREEIFSKTKEYNKVARELYARENANFDEDDDEYLYDSDYNLICVFEKVGMHAEKIEPSKAEYWIASALCY